MESGEGVSGLNHAGVTFLLILIFFFLLQLFQLVFELFQLLPEYRLYRMGRPASFQVLQRCLNAALLCDCRFEFRLALFQFALGTRAPVIQVPGDASTGEIEAFILKADNELWVGIGSDHTDAPVFLARNAWHLDKAAEEYPDVAFHKTKEQLD